MNCPPIPKELIEYLEQMVPERCPNIADSDREIWLYAGRRLLVRSLRATFEAQTRDVLSNPILEN